MKNFLLATIAFAFTFSQAQADEIVPPDWSLPHSATHNQVPPPAGFHRPTVNFAEPIGVFDGQSDVGGPLLPGAASYDEKTGTYAIDSASYNIWYFRDEFRYLWKRMEGDVSLAADISFPVAEGFFDRKVVLIFRQELDDDAKEVMVALHGGGLVHLATRPDKGSNIAENFRIVANEHTTPAPDKPVRLGIEKKGDAFTLWIDQDGHGFKQVGKTGHLELDAPFYVGIAMCSHLPVTSDRGVVTNLVLENEAGKVR